MFDKCQCVTYLATAVSWRATLSRHDGSLLTVSRRRGQPPISWRSSSPRGQPVRSGDPDSRTRKLNPEDVGAYWRTQSRSDPLCFQVMTAIAHADLKACSTLVGEAWHGHVICQRHKTGQEAEPRPKRNHCPRGSFEKKKRKTKLERSKNGFCLTIRRKHTSYFIIIPCNQWNKFFYFKKISFSYTQLLILY